MIIISLRNGWEPRGELRFEEGGGWLRDSQQEAAQLAPLREPTMRLLPAILGGLVIAIGVVLSFVVFW
jgi:hypothetical protein